MPYAYRVWYISEFIDEISQQLKIKYQIENFSIHQNTIDNWFKKMEEEKIHFLHRDDFKSKIYDDTDLNIACYLNYQTKVKDKTIGLFCILCLTILKKRTWKEANMSIFETNREADKLSKISDDKYSNKKNPKSIIKKRVKISQTEESVELSDVLKKEITFNGKILTSEEKQRIVDFLSGLVWPINNM